MVVVCIIGIVVSLSRMVPAGLAGDVHTVKFWFGALVAFLVIGISATFAFTITEIGVLMSRTSSKLPLRL